MKTKSRWVSYHLASALLALPVLGMTVPAFAAAPPAEDSVTVISNPATVATTAAEYGIPTTYDGQSLTGITEVMRAASVSTSGISSDATPEWFWQSDEIRDVHWEEIQVGSIPLETITGTGPTTLTLSNTYSVSNSWNASVSVPASIVSAAVGFSVTKSNSVTLSNAQQVPAGETETVVAYPEFSVFSFQVWVPNNFNGNYTDAGTGSASHFTGIYYAVYSG